jgi:hypothetical protein
MQNLYQRNKIIANKLEFLEIAGLLHDKTYVGVIFALP